MARRKYINMSSGVEHQLSSNFCTNHGISNCLEALFAKRDGKITPLSNAWGMMLCKKDNFDKRNDATGAPIDIELSQVCRYGMCTYDKYPTWEMTGDVNDNKFVSPTEEMYSIAKKFKPKGFHQIKTIDEVIDAIDNRGGVVAIVRLYPNHVASDNGFVGIKKGQHSKGLHCIWMCGYDLDLERVVDGKLEKGFVILQESYGESRGYKGYLYVPIDYIIHPKTGDYSYETYIKEMYAFDIDEELPYKNIFDNVDVVVPKNEITMTIGSTKCNHNGIDKKIVMPTVIDGRTYLPLRSIGELLDCAVRWYESEKKITIYNKALQMNVTMWLGSKRCVVQDTLNGTREIELLAEPICPNGSTLLPVRDIGTIFRMDTSYDSKTKQVKLVGLL